MLEHDDDYCRIMIHDDAMKNQAIKALFFVNIEKPDAERLMNEPHLEVRKYRCGKPMMDESAVVKCSKGILWNIPRKILEKAIKK